MQRSIMVCAKCGSQMTQGFIMTPLASGFSKAASGHIPKWYAGEFKSGFWSVGGTGDEEHPLTAFRCKDCGLLEFYAG